MVEGRREGLRTTLVSRNVTVDGRRTSLRLEPQMWEALDEVAVREGCSVSAVCSLIDRQRRSAGRAQTSLTAAVRVFVLAYFREAATEEGHRRAAGADLC